MHTDVPAGGRLAPGFAARLNLALDIALLVLSLFLATPLTGMQVSHVWIWFTLAAIATWMITGTALRHYTPGSSTDRDSLDDAALVTVMVVAVTTLLALVNLLVPASTELPLISRFLLICWPSMLSMRLVVLRGLALKERPVSEALIVGVGSLGRLTGEDLQKYGRHHLVGYLRFRDEAEPQRLPSRYLGAASDLESVLRVFPVDEVFIAGNSATQAADMQVLIKVCENLGVPFALPAYTFRLERARPVSTAAISDGYLHYLSITTKPNQLALKRLFDIVSSAVTLWMLLPLLTMVALLIKLSSRGPLFFKQQRVGLRGKPFNMLKFRSMVMDAEKLKAKLATQNEQSGPVFKMKNDPRITSVGRFIRKYSIDELPQLVNVLRGDMSVVGPRPPVPSEVERYEAWQRRRLSVRPGLTCIWQVSGRNQISFEQWMYLDMQYIDHWSLSQDLNLIFKTLPVVFTGRGAS